MGNARSKARKGSTKAGITQAAAAERLGISARMLRKHTAEKRIPRNDDGSYPWPEVREAYEALKAEALSARQAGFGDDAYQEQRSRLTRLKADAAEMENQVRRGDLIDVADQERLLRGSLERVNAVLKTVPSRYGTKLARRSKLRLPEARGLLSDIVEAVRAELRGIPGKDAS